MKKSSIVVALLAGMLAYGCGNGSAELSSDLIKDNASAENPDGNAEEMANIVFSKYEHNFGVITEGEQVETTFTFKNEGKANLIISEARGDCGCTVPSYPKEPISPGKEGKITVSFNSSGKVGENTKRVTVTTNSKEANAYLTINASVLPKK
jgi:hypothetical protein